MCVRARASTHAHVCVYVLVWVMVAYCVCMGKWYIMHVYEKVHAQHVILTGCQASLYLNFATVLSEKILYLILYV